MVKIAEPMTTKIKNPTRMGLTEFGFSSLTGFYMNNKYQ
jgi:hypothetical protein